MDSEEGGWCNNIPTAHLFVYVTAFYIQRPRDLPSVEDKEGSGPLRL